MKAMNQIIFPAIEKIMKKAVMIHLMMIPRRS